MGRVSPSDPIFGFFIRNFFLLLFYVSFFCLSSFLWILKQVQDDNRQGFRMTTFSSPVADCKGLCHHCFLPFLWCQSPASNLEFEWAVWAIGDRVEVVAGGATFHAFLFFRNVAEVRGIVANTAFALVKDWLVHGVAGGPWRYAKFWKRLFYRGEAYRTRRWNHGCWHHQHQSKN